MMEGGGPGMARDGPGTRTRGPGWPGGKWEDEGRGARDIPGYPGMAHDGPGHPGISRGTGPGPGVLFQISVPRCPPTRDIPRHPATSRDIPRHPATSRDLSAGQDLLGVPETERLAQLESVDLYLVTNLGENNNCLIWTLLALAIANDFIKPVLKLVGHCMQIRTWLWDNGLRPTTEPPLSSNELSFRWKLPGPGVLGEGVRG